MGAWSCRALVERLEHPEAAVRRWAAVRLRVRYPQRAPQALAACLGDSDRGLATLAAEVLEGAADPHFGPVLLERFRGAEGLLAGRLAAALGAADYRPALPDLLGRLERPERDVRCLEGLCRALGQMGQAAALREAIGRGSERPEAAGHLAAALIEAGDEADITWLAEQLWGRFTPAERAAAAEAIAADLSALELLRALRWALREGIGEAVDAAEAWIGRQVPWPAGRLHRLVPLWWEGPASWLGALAAERPAGAVDALAGRAGALLAALAAAAPAEAPEEGLSDLSLVLTCVVAVSWDEAEVPATALALLGDRRERVAAAVEDAALALGPAALPGLLEILGGGEGAAATRAARVITRLLRADPGLAPAAVEPLLGALRRGDRPLAEAAVQGLIAAGTAALEPTRRALLGGADGGRWLLEVLGDLPDPEAARTLLRYADSVGFMDELVVAALVDSGSALAVEPLAAAWSPGLPELAEALLLLCAVNDIQHPRREDWRRDLGSRRTLRWSRELDARRRERSGDGR